MWSNMNTTQPQGQDRSQLFLVRLWAERGIDNEQKEWHGRVQHVVSGEAHSFHDWPTLVDLLLAMLPPALTIHSVSVPPGGEHPEDPDR
jgi:hypothetical protein